MKEKIEKLRDEALLAQFPIDKQLKITMALTMTVQRQLKTLATKTNTPIEDMDREFLLENLANIKVTETHKENAIKVVDRVIKTS